MTKESQEFTERKELIRLQTEADENKHKLKMDQLAFERESQRLFHERELERGRIKSAEIRKNLQRKSDYEFMRSTEHKG